MSKGKVKIIFWWLSPFVAIISLINFLFFDNRIFKFIWEKIIVYLCNLDLPDLVFIIAILVIFFFLCVLNRKIKSEMISFKKDFNEIKRHPTEEMKVILERIMKAKNCKANETYLQREFIKKFNLENKDKHVFWQRYNENIRKLKNIQAIEETGSLDTEIYLTIRSPFGDILYNEWGLNISLKENIEKGRRE
ncbi:MAG: hypothetical protein JXB26_03010 [Candidatus Aminicenantes bacterium]|nr:hypothetical protein [Candidatus Aminicenantes bacterium]